MRAYRTPGVYIEEEVPIPSTELRTGVPAFLGYAAEESQVQPNNAQMLTLGDQFEVLFNQAPAPPTGYLAHTVRGFFENGGGVCYVVLLDAEAEAEAALDSGLAALAPLDVIDLICAPDIERQRTDGLTPDAAAVARQQAAVLKHCDSLGDRFAIFDSRSSGSLDRIMQQRQMLNGTNGALYFPWLDVGERDTDDGITYVPPCGHVAGVIARTDQRVGVHKAPANEILTGVVDLQINLSNAQQGDLNDMGINCLRAFPGRGIRVWGARTVSSDSAWRYISTRRLFLTAGRWIERNLAGVVYEPNDPALWNRIRRELTVYFTDLFRQGALQGRTVEEAFYVKCDTETNPPAVRERGEVITEIGLAPAVPNEFVVVRIMHSAGVTTIEGPSRPI